MMCTSYQELGGYDNVHFCEDVPDSLNCPICLLPLRPPHILSCCGAKYCEPCIGRVKAVGRPCPLCNQEFQSMIDRTTERCVLSLKTYCSRKNDGCEWEGELRYLRRHETDECEWAVVECRYSCGEHIPRCLVAEHERSAFCKLKVSIVSEVGKLLSGHCEAMTARFEEMKEEMKKKTDEAKQMLVVVSEKIDAVSNEVTTVKNDVTMVSNEVKAVSIAVTAANNKVKEIESKMGENKMESAVKAEVQSCREDIDKLSRSLSDQVKKTVKTELAAMKPSPEHSEIVEFPNDQNIITDKPLQFIIVVNNSQGQPVPEESHFRLSSELMPRSESTITQAKVTHIADNRYTVTFSPPLLRGHHSLSVSLNDKFIAGCPRNIFINHPVTLLGTTEPRIFPFDKVAWCATLDSEGKVYVPVESKIHVFANTGELDTPLETRTSGIACSGITVDNNGFIYVADSNHHITKLDKEGQDVKSVGGKGDKKMQFNNPSGIAFSNKTGNLYVTDTYNRRIQVLNVDLELVSVIEGKPNASFGFFKGIAVDQDNGTIYSADCDCNRIRVFTQDGQRFEFSPLTSLSSPRGVFVSRQYVYVTELYSSRVLVFEKDGTLIHSFITKASHPTSIVVDEDGFVYVCDAGKSSGFLRSSLAGTRMLVF